LDVDVDEDEDEDEEVTVDVAEAVDLNAWQSQAAFLCGIFKRFAALSFMYLFQESFLHWLNALR